MFLAHPLPLPLHAARIDARPEAARIRSASCAALAQPVKHRGHSEIDQQRLTARPPHGPASATGAARRARRS